MLAGKQRYRDISPVTLEVVGGVVSASLYCGEVEGLPADLVDSFLAELYRCKVCQFTCSLKASISSHLQLRHHPAAAAALSFPGSSCADEVGGAKDRDAHGEAEPYQLDLNEEPKPSDEDEDFLLYGMLDNMSPPSCDISSEGGLQVAHTCEVSTLFEEEAASIFPLKEASVDLSCSMDAPPTQEDTAQSAHLMTLGLCRISSAKASPGAAARPAVRPPPPSRRTASRKQRLLCFLCPLQLPSRRLLDVHVRSHQAAGGFGCVCCSWKADSWEEMEPHWRSHCRRKEQKQEKKKRRRSRKQQDRKDHQPTPETYAQRHHDDHPGQTSCTEAAAVRPRRRLIGREQADRAGRQSRGAQTGSLENISQKKKKAEEGRHGALSCSVCHRKFSSKLTLRRHMGVHGGAKPFSCPHCCYSSRLKASLLQHLRTHTGEKPYRCPDCAYASIDRSSLLRHYRTHSQEKPYRCQHCSYRSIQKKSLDLHARRHHTGEAFPCQQCEYSSPDRQLLLRHVRTRHAAPQHAAP